MAEVKALTRTSLIGRIIEEDPSYRDLNFDKLSIDDLLVIYKSVEAHRTQMGGLCANSTLSFEKLSDKTFFIKHN